MSRIRTNLITNRMANGAPTVSNGLVISGITTSTTFSGSGASLTNIPSAQLTGALPALDGSNLTGLSGVSVANQSDNRLITATGTTDALNGEANLTFDGSVLTNTGSTLISNDIKSSDDDFYVYSYKGGSDGQVRSGIHYDGNSQRLRFFTGTNERLRIDSNGRTLFTRGGLTASRNVGTKTGEIQVANSGNSSAISIISYTNDVGGPHLVFGKSRAGNATGSTIVQSGDRLGEIAFCGADGTDIDSFGAAIKCHVDGTPGANDMPGRLEFYTTGDGGASAVERLRIPSTGGIELKTDGKGIQFPTPQTPYHASSNRVGISSEMRYYETGTLTPGLSSTVLNGLQIATFTDGSYARRVNRYVRVGHIVHCFIEIKMAGSVTYNAGSTSTAPVCITGTCPFKWAYSGRYDVSGEPDFIPCSISYDSSGLTNDSVYAVLTRNYNAQPRIDITRVGSGGSRQFNSVNFGMVFPANASIAVAYSYPIDLDNADY